MPRFLTGDELGNIKAVHYSPDNVPPAKRTETKIIHTKHVSGTSNSVQALAVAPRQDGSTLLAAVYSDASASAFFLGTDDSVKTTREWAETRMKPTQAQRYVGLSASQRGIFSCTSNGALRMTSLENEDESAAARLASLPMRLSDWRLSANEETFAYGGDEVELSVWNTEAAFTPRSEDLASSNAASKKRKRNDDLFPGEIWRAKNVPNDSLGLRQPVRITSLTYLAPSSSTHHLVTGTQLGDVRRYDTRIAHRPVADWKDVGKAGGIKLVEKGLSEHELFVSDNGYNLFSVDLRNGRIVYGYKGLSGAVTSIAPSPTILASTALDRLARIHSVFPPPAQAGQRQDRRGDVLDKVFMTSVPTVIVWDQNETPCHKNDTMEPEDDDVWDNMENIDDNDDAGGRTKRRNAS